jgi:ABC-type bacteriocin/lantibiotic exporter with double-glycine peptidase domain
MKIIIKRLKASTIHTVLTLVWVVLVLPTLFWWQESVMWVALMSLWANIASHWAAREAAKAKESQR